ncbi:metallophosphoesterase family protein [Gracilibacillus salinarum]|uniref:Metallophosphatase family protein n=1 Tax=Gracilibacillus salinarum TaxID=2932255 RepID=A0ABY4GH13_9BACI|nr:metallophosphoesterase family protein [Gracilibacillus salinarum]UOQ83618.1 metallophosphatase family protein [Gracilibacillus salinarum]
MTSKIAIITDIHGNAAALQTVLDDIDQDKQVAHIYCLGDLIGIGHQTNEVLDLLLSRTDISFIRGNHEESVLRILEGKEPLSTGEERKHHYWIAERLDKAFVPALLHMPMTREQTINGKHFLFLHYHIQEKKQFSPIDCHPSAEKLDTLYQHSKADVICFGHHHVIHHFQSNKKLYLNPGALGCNHHPFAPYATIQIGNEGQMDISFKEVAYDNKDFLLAFQTLRVPASAYILKNFYGEQHVKWHK